MNLAAFEKQIMSNLVDLSTLKKSEPIKTTEERRSEWLMQRRGKFTASEFYKLMTNGKKIGELSVGAKTYAMEKAVEMITEMDDTENYISVDMQWGIDHELKAIAAFEASTGLECYQTGDNQKLMLLGDNIGCSPDGLIGEIYGIEVKCPKSKTHFEYSLFKSQDDLKLNCPNYYWQIQGSMLVTGREKWWFCSYDPRFKNEKHRLFVLPIERNNDDIQILIGRLEMAVLYRNEFLDRFSLL